MGSFLSTQLQWSLADGKWKIDAIQSNFDAIYILYLELCELYLRWYRQQDLMFSENCDKKTEDALLLTTPFARMLRFPTLLNMSSLSGEISSEERLNTMMVQQHKLKDIQSDTMSYISACMNTTPRHRRDPIARRTSIAGLEDSPESLEVWGEMPDIFWKLYRVADKATVLSSVDEINVRTNDSQQCRDEFAIGSDTTTPSYSVTEDDNNSHYCSVWTLQHLIHHLGLLLTVAFPAVTLHSSSSKYFLPCDNSYLLESVRLGLSRCYLFVDKDHMIIPSVPTQTMHSVLLNELIEIMECLANCCTTETGQGDQCGGAEAAISRIWQKVVIGECQTMLSEGKRSGSVADVLRSRASVARIFNTSDPSACNPVRSISCIPMKMLNDVLSDTNSLAIDRQPSHTSSKRQRSLRSPSQRPINRIHSEDHRLSASHVSLFETPFTRSNLGSIAGDCETPKSDKVIGLELGSTQWDDKDSSSTAIAGDEEEEGSVTESQSTAETSPAKDGSYQRRRIPPAMMDLSGDLRLLTPCEITAAMVSQCHREDFDDVNDACRRDDYKKWKRYERQQSEPTRLSSRRETVNQQGKPDFPLTGQKDALWLQYSADSPNIHNQNAESVKDRERKRREQQHKKSVETWEAECHSENEDDENGVHDDHEFRKYSGGSGNKEIITKLQIIGDVSKKLLQYKPLRRAAASTSLPGPTDCMLSVTSNSKISVNKLSTLQRLVFSMIWQQLDLQLMSVMSLRHRAGARQSVLSLQTVDFEVSNASCLSRKHKKISPLISIQKDSLAIPPWKVALGYLAEITANIADEPSLKIVACQAGWYLTTATNNIDTHFTTCEPAPVCILGKDVSEMKSSPYYSSVVMLLRDNSEGFRSFLKFLDCSQDVLNSDTTSGSPVSPQQSRVGESPRGTPSKSKGMQLTFPEILNDSSYCAISSPLVSEFSTSLKSPFPPRKGKSKVSAFHRKETQCTRKSSVSQVCFIDRDKKRKNIAESLRLQQQTPVEISTDDAQSVGSISIDDSLPITGYNILTHGPERKTKRKKTTISLSPTNDMLADEKGNLVKNGSGSSLLSNEITQTADITQSNGESVTEPETISSVVKRDAFDVRNWNLYCDNNVRMRHFVVTDLLTTGFSNFNEFSYIVKPSPVCGASAFKVGCTVSLQWVHFLDPSVKQARMLFALRSLLEGDMTKAANQAVIFQASGIENLCLAIPRRIDYRIRICSAKVLLCVAQNPEAVKMMSTQVIKTVSEVLSTGSYDAGADRSSSGRRKSEVIFLKSGNLSKLANLAAQSKDPPRRGAGSDAKTDHHELLSIIVFLFASMALSCSRSREMMWKYDIGGVAVSLFADKSLPNCLHVGVIHFLRALLIDTNDQQRRLSKLTGVIPATINFMKPTTGTTKNSCSLIPITGLQAVCGLIITLSDNRVGLSHSDAVSLLKQTIRNIDLLSNILSSSSTELLTAVEHAYLNCSVNPSTVISTAVSEHILRTRCFILLFQSLERILQRIPKNISTITKSLSGVLPLLKSHIDLVLNMFNSLSNNLLHGKSHKLDKGPLKAFLPIDFADTKDDMESDSYKKDKHQGTLLLLTSIVGVLVSLVGNDSEGGSSSSGVSLKSMTEEAMRQHPDFINITSSLLSVESLVNPSPDSDVGCLPRITGILLMLKGCAASLLGSLSVISCSSKMVPYTSVYIKEITASRSLSVVASLCTALRNLSSRHPDVREFLLKRSNMTILWQLIQSTSHKIRISAAECLRAMIYPGNIDRESARLESDCFVEGFLSCVQDEISALVSLLDADSHLNILSDQGDYTGVQVAICNLIAAICHFRNSEVLLAAEGLLPRLMKMCKSKNPDLLAAATHCIWLAALYMPKEVDYARGIQVLADKLCTSSELSDRYIILTLHALVTSHEGCSLSCIQSGIVPHLVKFLGSNDSSVKSTVAATLSAIRRSQRQTKHLNNEK